MCSDGKRLSWAFAMVVGLLWSADMALPPYQVQPLVHAAQPSDAALQESADAMMKNAEEMVAHGGMGDAKAIIHHCAETSRYAETLLAQIPPADPRRSQAAASLSEVIAQCKKVSDIGPHADPGRLLNPAIKARTAARESVKSLGLNPKS